MNSVLDDVCRYYLARREIPRNSNEWFPVFNVNDDGMPDVDLNNLENHFNPNYRFLLLVFLFKIYNDFASHQSFYLLALIVELNQRIFGQ